MLSPVHSETTPNSSEYPYDSNGTKPVTRNALTRFHAPAFCSAHLCFRCHAHTRLHAPSTLLFRAPRLLPCTRVLHSSTVSRACAIPLLWTRVRHSANVRRTPSLLTCVADIIFHPADIISAQPTFPSYFRPSGLTGTLCFT